MKPESAIQDIYPLSPMQKGILFHCLYENGSHYIEQASYTLEGRLDVSVFEKSLNELIKRHDILRTNFVHDRVDEPLQVVRKNRTVSVSFLDIRHYDKAVQEEQIHNYKVDDRKNGFDLTRDPLVRVTLIQTADSQFVCLWTFHHILMDGWCIGVLISEFYAFYAALIKGFTPQLPVVPPYKNYIQWLQQQDGNASLSFWKNYLSGYDLPNALPIVRRDPTERSFKKATRRCRFDSATTSNFKSTATKLRVTPNTVLQAVWGIVLAAYNNSSDVVVGTVVSGRPPHIPGIETMVGLFINTVPLRIRLPKDMSFAHLVKDIWNDNRQIDKHQYLPLADVQNVSELRQNLIDHIFVFENYPIEQQINVDTAASSEEQSIQLLNAEVFEQTNYALNLLCFMDEELLIKIDYDANSVQESEVEKILSRISIVLNQVVENENIFLREIDLVTKAEHQQLAALNSTETALPVQGTVAKLFEEQVQKRPHDIVLTSDGQNISFEDLNRRANQLAHHIMKRGVGRGNIVALICDPSPEMLISLMAILKTGAAYLPVSPTLPIERQKYILSDADAKLIILNAKEHSTTSVQKSLYDTFGVVFLHDVESILRKESAANPAIQTEASDLMYVMYTSGSTGRPKGVMIEHQGIVNRLFWMWQRYGYTYHDTLILKTSFVFDVSVIELFLPLCFGAKLVIATADEILDPALLIDCVERHSITSIHFIPGMFQEFVSFLKPLHKGKLSSLRLIFTSGEALLPDTVKMHYDKLDVPVCNLYGPTEASVEVSFYETKKGDVRIPIGKPISNTRLFIIDKFGNLAAPGMTGEIGIAGMGVARGYLNNLTLTSSRFVDLPYHNSGKTYLTGDIGRILDDGNIEFLGRNDSQVKIRGYRIELAEIESALVETAGVRNAVVIAVKDTGNLKRLVAFVVADSKIGILQIKQHLQQRLPEYMIPASIKIVEALPVTATGKIDRSALGEIANEHPTSPMGAEPRNETELQITQIWKKLLNRDEVSIDCNFFESGGHSLLAIQLCSRINKQLNTALRISAIFQYPTIRLLAGKILESKTIETSALDREIPKAPERDNYATSFGQRRIWVLDKIDQVKTAYNIRSGYTIKGELDISSLEKAWTALVKRHEILRTTFLLNGEELRQVIHKEVPYDSLAFTDLSTTGEEAPISAHSLLQSHYNTVFNLNTLPLAKALLLKTAANEFVFGVVMHHIISDGWSMEILQSDLMKLYSDISAGRIPNVTPLEVQYKDYAENLNSTWQQGRMKKSKEYWHQKFSDAPPILNLLTDLPRPLTRSYRGNSVDLSLDEAVTARIRSFAAQHDASVFIVLLSLLKGLMARYTQQYDIVIGTPIAGRSTDTLEKQVGYYANTVALRTKFDEGDTMTGLMKKVRQTCIEAFEHEIYPFDLLVGDLALERDTSRSPLFDVMLVLQSQRNLSSLQANQLGNLAIEKLSLETSTSQFDLTFNCVDNEKTIDINIVYSTDLFVQWRIESMADHFRLFAAEALRLENNPLPDITYISEREKHRILIEYNATRHAFSDRSNLVELFEQQVVRTPDKMCLIDQQNSMTFRRVNEHANKLASFIQTQHGKQKGRIIALYFEPSNWRVITILAILKSGAAYLPLDTQSPSERIKSVLTDAGVSLLISDVACEWLDTSAIRRFSIADAIMNWPTLTDTNPSLDISPDDLAYCIFTSGSTGRPKGVLIEQRSVVNRMNWMWRELQFTQQDVVLHKTPYIFDVSVWEIFLPLCWGTSMVISNKDVIYDVHGLYDLIEEHKITSVHFVPAMFNIFLEELTETSRPKLNSLRVVITSGEALMKETVRRYYDKFAIPLYNFYGPTEATVDVTFHKTSAEDLTIPIGQPIDNCEMFVLDSQLRPVPHMVTGELYIGGVGTGRGYVNNVALTAEKFIPSSLTVASPVLYKTGDLGFWNHHGKIEYIGRNDNQVKIKGVRIEIGEIENALLSNADIAEAAVVATGSSDKVLVAFLVSEKTLGLQNILDALGNKLPPYLLPTTFRQLSSLPLTPTGKVDRNKLLTLPYREIKPEITDTITNASENEALVIQLLKNILGRDEIKKNENFFHLGGDSIKAILLSTALMKHGYSIKVREIFQFPVVEHLATKLKQNSVRAKNDTVWGVIPLTPIQQMIVDRNVEDPHHYNQSMILHFRESITVAQIETIFSKLAEHHDALRIVFRGDRHNAIQYNCKPGEVTIDCIEHDLTGSTSFYEDLNRLSEAVQQSIDLEAGPLIKLAIFRTTEGDLLLIVIHHLVTDGVSWRILIEDLETLYKQYKSNTLLAIELKTDSYKTWAEELVKYANSEDFLENEKTYWTKSTKHNCDRLPVDQFHPTNYLADRERTQIEFDSDETAKLVSSVLPAFGIEINDLLVATLATSINKTFKLRSIGITMEGHGREEILENVNIHRTIGWFTSSYPVLIECSEPYNLEANIHSVRQILQSVPSKGVGYQILKYLTKDDLKKEVAFNLAPEISFNFLGQFDQHFDNAIFEVANLPIGNKMSPKTQSVFRLDVSGLIVSNMLKLTISYNRNQYNAETVERLAANWRRELRNSIALVNRVYSNSLTTT